MTRLWDKGSPLDERVLRYTAGEDHALDNRLVQYDVRASIAHAQMLHEQALLSAQDLSAIKQGLSDIATEHAAGKWQVSLQHEDGQTALETLLVERIGEAGKRVHLGRSRNDQVLTALRLYLRDVVDVLSERLLAVVQSLDDLAAREGDIALPGYTHMQQAMPSSVALWTGGFAAEFRDNAEGLAHVRRRLSKSPLGSAAGYGSPNLPIDRERTSRELGFDTPQEPVTAVQLSRGKAEAQLAFEISLIMQDAARLSADLLLFYTQEFSFVQLPDAFTTGSSIMPQKRNPDVFELIRGRSATAQACVLEITAITAKLPSGYQRDLQLIKAPLFRSIDSCLDTLAILPAALAGVRFRRDRIKLDPSIHAASEANALVVKRGIPFRDAYRIVGEKLKEGVDGGQRTADGEE